MADRVGRDGEATEWERMAMPAVAKSYFLRMTMVAHPMMGMRSSREIQTLSVVMGFLANGKYHRAADVLAQRLKALEQVVVEGGWEKAAFLELFEAPNTAVLSKDEELLLVKEQ